MNCTNCARENDIESNFCKYCGNNLRQTIPGAAVENPHHTLFDNLYQVQAKPNTELGYLIISILILINVFLWIAWGFLSGSIIQGNEVLFKGVRLLSVIFAISQFVVMFIFTKRQSYKIVISVVGVIVTLYDLYYLMQTLTNLR